MRVRFSPLLAAVAGLFLAAVPTFSHHGFGVEFDGSKCLDLHGTLTDIDWENPHAYVHLDVKGADGKTVPWSLEMITPNALKRNGTTRQDFLTQIGKPMAARACPAKAGGTENRGAAEYIKLADGQLRIVGQLVEKLTPDQLSF